VEQQAAACCSTLVTRYRNHNYAALFLNGKPYISTLARFNESSLLELDLHAFRVLEKPLPLLIVLFNSQLL